MRTGLTAIRIWLSAAVLAAALAACGSENGGGEPSPSNTVVGESEPSGTYRVVLGNAITDTLRGRAAFGIVVEPVEQRERFVIRLKSDFDFAGGFVLARRDTLPPEPGAYQLDVTSGSLGDVRDDQFLMLYREGMLRDLRAVSGSATLSTVTDTLIVGTFDAVLRGRVAGIERPLGGAAVHAVGRFRAERDLDGFIIGI
ncbi:MAG: hypothetical protein WD423_01220 [Rhodothermales bacterium]